MLVKKISINNFYAAVSEWSNVHAWKACEQQCSEGSNPSCCANIKNNCLFL